MILQKKQEEAVGSESQLFDDMQLFLQKHLPMLPPGLSPAVLNSILDVGCGMHLWGRMLFRTMVQQVGHDLLDGMRIEGIDNRPEVVQAANASIRTGRGQVKVIEGDFFSLSKNRTASYDLVHVRCLCPYITPHQWLQLLKELERVCKPGGWLIWSEPSLPTFNDNAVAWRGWLKWIEEALIHQGGSPYISSMMERLIYEAKTWKSIEVQPISLPLVPATHIQGSLPTETLETIEKRLQPFRQILLATGMSAQVVDGRLREVLDEFNHRGITSEWTWTVIYAQKGNAS